MFSPFSGFKWFGSLTNLRRKSESQKDDVKGVSTDDMGMHPRSPSYASSSEMYTHMGTMPRHPKKDKSLKKSKSKDKTNLSQSQSMRPSQDHVVDSPLLSVLSGKGLEALENPILEDKPAAGTRDNHIQNRDLPPPPTMDGHSTKLEDDEPLVDSKPHIDPPNACLEPSADLSQSKEPDIQPVLPKKRHKEGDTSMKDAKELQVDGNLIQLPLKHGSQVEQKQAVEEDAKIRSDCKQDSQEEKEPNR